MLTSIDASDMMAKHAFVGIVDEEQCLALVQHGTKLHLINYANLGSVRPTKHNAQHILMGRDKHFYQLGLRQFGALDRLKLDPPPDLRELLEIGLQDEPLAAHGLNIENVASVSKRFMCRMNTKQRDQSDGLETTRSTARQARHGRRILFPTHIRRWGGREHTDAHPRLCPRPGPTTTSAGVPGNEGECFPA